MSTAAPSSIPPTGMTSLRKSPSWLRAKETLIRSLLFGCALVSVITTLAIIFVLLYESVIWFVPGHSPFFAEVSLGQFFLDTRWTPQYSEKHFGILPLLCGTAWITLISGCVGLPLGLVSAIYMSEYAGPRRRAVLKPVLELLAGIPTIVYGYFGVFFVTPYVLRPILQSGLGLSVDGQNALSGGIVVGLMIMPLVASLSEDVLRAVPKTLREAGYALGATKFDVSVKIVVPAALSGILASFLLALSRAIGETMAVTIAAGSLPQLTATPAKQIQTMTSFIVNVMKGDAVVGSIEYKSLYAVALVLFLTTLTMNYISQLILQRYREVYQ
ncbi:MAG: phosphate ABC transporter permease subunit PstC [Planctomycetales bacterium 12-60-4]|nr:MAG: phosphate ABC transporter permease subunit PstC [Planctomycetales bacterium 12-60-4]